jgi:hypothetical protein
MGQRHQIFLKVPNPYKNESLGLRGKEKKKAGFLFGRGKYTVIALHHQWLFGRAALGMLSHIMNVTNPETANKWSNPFGERFYAMGSSYDEALDDYIKKVMMMIQVITDPDFPRGVGVERMHFLNYECVEDSEYIERWDMRKYFDIGDNNDGITIIDTIERKYCFMNIYHQETDEECQSVSLLPEMEPASAKDYVEAYYPDKEDEEENQKFIDKVKGFKVLTKKEIAKIFPKMKEKLFRETVKK